MATIPFVKSSQRTKPVRYDWRFSLLEEGEIGQKHMEQSLPINSLEVKDHKKKSSLEVLIVNPYC